MASLLQAVRTAFSAFSKAYKSTPSPGERQMANMFAAPWAYPGTWSGEKIAQVEAYRGWVAVCVRFLSHKIGTVPTACYVNQGGERLKWQSRVKAWHAGKGEQPEHRRWVSKVRQKSLTGPIKEDEDVEYLDDDHPLIRLINDPNEPDVGSDFWPYFTMFRFLCGESYIWKVRKGTPNPEASGRDRGDVVEMWVLPSPWVTPRPGKDRLIDHYEVRPYTSGSTGGPVILHRDDVIRWSEKSPIHPLGSYGQTQSAAAAIDVYQMLETARYNGLNNGGDPGSVWILPEGVSNVSPEVMRDLASRFQGRYAGVRNAGVPLVLPGGSTFVPRDGQVEVAYAQSLDQMRDYVMAHYGLDKSLMGFSDSSTYAASVIGMQRLKHQVIAPEQMQLAQLLTERLAVEFDDDIAIVFQEGPTLIDPDERRANWQLAINHPAGPCVTKNEVRVELLGKEPIDDDPNADLLFYQPGLIKSEDLDAVGSGDMGGMLGEATGQEQPQQEQEQEAEEADNVPTSLFFDSLDQILLGGGTKQKFVADSSSKPSGPKRSGIFRDSRGNRYRLEQGIRVPIGDSDMGSGDKFGSGKKPSLEGSWRDGGDYSYDRWSAKATPVAKKIVEEKLPLAKRASLPIAKRAAQDPIIIEELDSLPETLPKVAKEKAPAVAESLGIDVKDAEIAIEGIALGVAESIQSQNLTGRTEIPTVDDSPVSEQSQQQNQQWKTPLKDAITEAPKTQKGKKEIVDQIKARWQEVASTVYEKTGQRIVQFADVNDEIRKAGEILFENLNMLKTGKHFLPNLKFNVKLSDRQYAYIYQQSLRQLAKYETLLNTPKHARPWHSKGKSGIYRDSAGRRYRLQDGVRVPVGDDDTPDDQGQEDNADFTRNPKFPNARIPNSSPNHTREGVPKDMAKNLTRDQAKEVLRKHDGMVTVGKNEPSDKLPDATRPQLDEVQSGALQKYTYLNDRPLNAILRGQDPGEVPYSQDFYAEMRDQLQSAFDKTPVMDKPITVVRGMNLNDAALEGFLSKMQQGQTVQVPGYMSTAAPGGFMYAVGMDSGIPKPFRGNVSLKIKAVHGIDMKPHSQLPGESEMLLPHNSQFKVLGVTKKKDGYHIELEQIPPRASKMTPDNLNTKAKSEEKPTDMTPEQLAEWAKLYEQNPDRVERFVDSEDFFQVVDPKDTTDGE